MDFCRVGGDIATVIGSKDGSEPLLRSSAKDDFADARTPLLCWIDLNVGFCVSLAVDVLVGGFRVGVKSLFGNGQAAQ